LNTNLKEITNFLAINENLGTAGMPQVSQFEEIANAGYKVVINLAVNESPGAISNEAEILSSFGISYIHIPVIWEMPDLVSLKTFLQTMDEYAAQKVLVHCVLNMRVSIFVYLYRLLRLGESPENAYESVLEIWEPDNTWQSFIHKALLAHAGGKI
jgi:protein tyrosine phosphatase (PTP) superfamily phosphohydrolase (DUF442 family)